MPNNTPGWGAFLPRYNIPETFGTAVSYEGQLHWFLENWNEVADYANALEQPTVTVGKTEFPDTSNALLPSITNSGTDINAVLDFVYPVIRTRFADPLDWDFNTAYDMLTVVRDTNGNSYTSRQDVPANTALSDPDYWVMTGSYDANLQEIRDDLAQVKSDYARVYPTAADMQADTTIVSGMICQTLGFHSVGDNGAAWYVIGSGTPNAMDVLQLSTNDSASLVITRTLHIASLGAVCDGSADDTAQLYRCIELAKSMLDVVNTEPGISAALYTPNGASVILCGTVRITETITTCPGVRICGNGSIILADGCDALNVAPYSGTVPNIGRGNQSMPVAEDLRIVGTDYGHTAIRIAAEVASTVQGAVFNSIYIANFAVGVSIGDNAYTCVFDKCSFNQDMVCVSFDATTNAGERITFSNSSFANSDTVYRCDTYRANDVYFNCCSIDYITGSISSSNSGRLFFNNCHIENNPITGIFANSGFLKFASCIISASGDTGENFVTNTGVVVFSGCSFASMYYNTLVSGGTVVFDSNNKVAATMFPNTLQPGYMDYSMVRYSGATAAKNGNTLTFTATGSSVYIVISSNGSNVLHGWSATINTAISSNVYIRNVVGAYRNDDGTYGYDRSLGSRALTAEEKAGSVPITARADVQSTQGCGLIITCFTASVGDTIEIDLECY